MSDAAIRGAGRAAPEPKGPARAEVREQRADGERFGDVLGRSMDALERPAPDEPPAPDDAPASDEEDRAFEDALAAEDVATAVPADATPAEAPPAVVETHAEATTVELVATAVAPSVTPASGSTAASTSTPASIPATATPTEATPAIAGTAHAAAPVGVHDGPVDARDGAVRGDSPVRASTAAPADPGGIRLDVSGLEAVAPTPVATAAPTIEPPLAQATTPTDAAAPASPMATVDPSSVAPTHPTAPSAAPVSTADAAASRESIATAPVQLSRAEDLTAAIERMRPIPQGGAMLEVEAPGLGAIRLHVAMQGETVRIRIHVQGNTDAVSWFAREHDGLCSAARQAVPESAGVELQLHCGADDRRGGSAERGPHDVDDELTVSTAPKRSLARVAAPSASTSRSLVDVIA